MQLWSHCIQSGTSKEDNLATKTIWLGIRSGCKFLHNNFKSRINTVHSGLFKVSELFMETDPGQVTTNSPKVTEARQLFFPALPSTKCFCWTALESLTKVRSYFPDQPFFLSWWSKGWLISFWISNEWHLLPMTDSRYCVIPWCWVQKESYWVYLDGQLLTVHAESTSADLGTIVSSGV